MEATKLQFAGNRSSSRPMKFDPSEAHDFDNSSSKTLIGKPAGSSQPSSAELLATIKERIECETLIESINHRLEELLIDERVGSDQYIQARDKRRHLMRELLRLRLREAELQFHAPV